MSISSIVTCPFVWGEVDVEVAVVVVFVIGDIVVVVVVVDVVSDVVDVGVWKDKTEATVPSELKMKDAQNLEIRGPWDFGQILLRWVHGVARKSRGVPFFMFYCIFMWQLFGPYPLPPTPFCVHLLIKLQGNVKWITVGLGIIRLIG
jgi:hypothetical protein